jgi:type II secretory pathway component GspD/PulD (secretin)
MMQQQIQMQMQQMQQQMQQAAQAAGGGTAAGRKKTDTRLVLNQRENMILVQAAPDQMATIERAIQQIDVESAQDSTLLQNLSRMKVYRLETIDPQILADLLQQLGDLEPGTVLRVDKKKKSIIAWASLADHLTITTLVDRLDQSARSFEVIPLRRLDAEYVAGTIRGLLGTTEDDKPKSSRSRYDYFYGYGMPQQQDEPKEREFKIDADLENNRVLVYANVVEMAEIRHLLQKLGELPDPNATDDGIRVFDLNPDENFEQLQQRLKKLWNRKNALEFDAPAPAPAGDAAGQSHPQKSDTDVTDPKVKSEATEDAQKPRDNGADVRPPMSQQNSVTKLHRPPAAPRADSDTQDSADQTVPAAEILTSRTAERSNDHPLQASAFDDILTAVVQQEVEAAPVPAGSETQTSHSPASKPSEAESALPAPAQDGFRRPFSEDSDNAPVKMAVTEDGRLIATSDDPAALAELEDLLGQLSKSRKNYKVFRLKYSTASWITLTLKDYFKADEQTESTMEYHPWYGYVPKEKKVKGNHSLSRRRQPSFISDNYTSTILVRDADARQLELIEDLIAIYDVPEPADTKSMRMNKMFRLQNARAASVAEAVKDVFRDLLSSNDKALESKDPNARPGSGGGSFMMLPPGEKKDGDDDEPVRFKGLLSIGIDESSNTLIVSSTASLMSTIGAMIDELDKAATSTSVVQIIKVDDSVDLTLIQERLEKLLSNQNPRGKNPQDPNSQQPNMPPGKNQNSEQPAGEGGEAVAE